MEAGIFAEISLILAIATVIAALTQLLKQPIIIGHILTGILVGPAVLNLVKSTETVELFSHIGVALLLFIIGLGLNPRVIKEVGKVALLTGLGQIVVTSIIGFGLARLLGFSSVVALYIAVGLTFSSTIIILKILSDKKEQHRLYGKITTGFLLVQDIIAITILMAVSSLAQEQTSTLTVALTLAKGMAALGILVFISVYILPRLANFISRSQEFLFLFSLGWGLGIASLAAILGFSFEIGALAAGVALASTPYSYEISSRMRPLRDFFVILFFIILGTSVSLTSSAGILLPVVLFSAYVLLGNPLLMMALMGSLGYTKKTSFKAGLTVAQISEFSLILILLGNRLGHLPDGVVAIMTLVGIITIAGSTYMMLYDDQLYRKLAPWLGVFERGKLKRVGADDKPHDIVLFGYKAGGHGFIKAFKRLGRSYLVVDYDPETIDHLKAQDIDCQYGDANDPEFLEELNLGRVRLVIINLTDFATNALIVDETRARSRRAIVIAMTKTDDKIEEALELYDRGASYVMMPRYLSSLKVGNLLKRYEFNASGFERAAGRHQKVLHSVRD